MTTKAALHECFASFTIEATRCGIIPTVKVDGKEVPGRWALEEGPSTAYRLYWIPKDPEQGRELTQPDGFSSYLGMSRKEAAANLWAYQTGLYAARVYGNLTNKGE